MKKNILWVLAAIMSMGILASCSDDDDDYYVYTLNLQKDTQIKYTDKGVWDKAYTTDDLYVDPFSFNHKGYDSYGGYFSGYVAAKTTDSGYFDDMLAHQFDVIAGGGAKGVGSPYVIGYWNSAEEEAPIERSTAICLRKAHGAAKAFTPMSVKICNTSYTYYCMTRGNNYCRKFEEGDYLKITAHGCKSTTSTEETTLDFYLARCEGNTDDWFVNRWTTWDLSALGEIEVLYFTMESTDKGAFGINTPTYFALDELKVNCFSNLNDK